MIRIAIDSDNLGDLPAGVAPILMTYADLISTREQLAELENHHQGSEIVLFDRGLGDPLGLASDADVETGALRPEQLPGWFDKKTAAGVAYLTVYCNQNTLPAVERAVFGTPYEHHWRHIARLDGIWTVPGFQPLHRPALVQVVNSSMLGLHADGSIVLNPLWHPGLPALAAPTEPVECDNCAEAGEPGAIPSQPDTAANAKWRDEDDPFPASSRPRPA